MIQTRFGNMTLGQLRTPDVVLRYSDEAQQAMGVDDPLAKRVFMVKSDARLPDYVEKDGTFEQSVRVFPFKIKPGSDVAEKDGPSVLKVFKFFLPKGKTKPELAQNAAFDEVQANVLKKSKDGDILEIRLQPEELPAGRKVGQLKPA